MQAALSIAARGLGRKIGSHQVRQKSTNHTNNNTKRVLKIASGLTFGALALYALNRDNHNLTNLSNDLGIPTSEGKSSPQVLSARDQYFIDTAINADT